jgi:large subunit ribosomal protein L30
MKTIRVKQVRSKIGRNPTTIRTLKALGLGAIGRERVLPVNPAVEGMLGKVKHLVEVTVA